MYFANALKDHVYLLKQKQIVLLCICTSKRAYKFKQSQEIYVEKAINDLQFTVKI